MSKVQATKRRMLKIRQNPVQQQVAHVDCGLFAIAYAIELCQGRRPQAAIFVQSKMRDHLLQCLSKRRLRSFPMKTDDQNQIRGLRGYVCSYQLYCYCNMPEDYDTGMAQCTKCHEWIHSSCAGNPEQGFKGAWKCSQCAGLGQRIVMKPLEFSYRKN